MEAIGFLRSDTTSPILLPSSLARITAKADEHNEFEMVKLREADNKIVIDPEVYGRGCGLLRIDICIGVERRLAGTP